LGARLGGGVHEDLIELDPADAEDGGTADRDDVVEHQHGVVEEPPQPHERRREPEQRFENADPLEHLDAGGLDPVRRERVAREAILVDEADLQSGPGEHRRERRARATRADDDDIEGVAHDRDLGLMTLNGITDEGRKCRRLERLRPAAPRRAAGVAGAAWRR
jgi:hypothetical protein